MTGTQIGSAIRSRLGTGEGVPFQSASLTHHHEVDDPAPFLGWLVGQGRLFPKMVIFGEDVGCHSRIFQGVILLRSRPTEINKLGNNASSSFFHQLISQVIEGLL
jgi:hypothetical protein